MAESTDYDSNALNHEPRDTRYPYSSSEDSNDTKHEGEPKPLFEGKLKMLQLTSNRICYVPCPEPDDEVEQHLTITANGRIWFSRYCFGENGKYRLLQKIHSPYLQKLQKASWMHLQSAFRKQVLQSISPM